MRRNRNLSSALPLLEILSKYSRSRLISLQVPVYQEEMQLQDCSILSNSHLFINLASNAIDVSVYVSNHKYRKETFY